jgi:hypothetical protein
VIGSQRFALDRERLVQRCGTFVDTALLAQRDAENLQRFADDGMTRAEAFAPDIERDTQLALGIDAALPVDERSRCAVRPPASVPCRTRLRSVR